MNTKPLRIILRLLPVGPVGMMFIPGVPEALKIKVPSITQPKTPLLSSSIKQSLDPIVIREPSIPITTKETTTKTPSPTPTAPASKYPTQVMIKNITQYPNLSSKPFPSDVQENRKSFLNQIGTHIDSNLENGCFMKIKLHYNSSSVNLKELLHDNLRHQLFSTERNGKNKIQIFYEHLQGKRIPSYPKILKRVCETSFSIDLSWQPVIMYKTLGIATYTSAWKPIGDGWKGEEYYYASSSGSYQHENSWKTTIDDALNERHPKWKRYGYTGTSKPKNKN